MFPVKTFFHFQIFSSSLNLTTFVSSLVQLLYLFKRRLQFLIVFVLFLINSIVRFVITHIFVCTYSKFNILVTLRISLFLILIIPFLFLFVFFFTHIVNTKDCFYKCPLLFYRFNYLFAIKFAIILLLILIQIFVILSI